MSVLFLDAEVEIRDYLRGLSALAALSAGRVYVGGPPPRLPDGTDYWITLRRIGGAPQSSTTPIDSPLLSLNCYGRSGEKAIALALAVADALTVDNVDRPPFLTENMKVLSSTVTLGPVNEPDPFAGKALPRYVVDVSMLVRGA